jgi:membrane protein implicated in regulation of membrane protease activity
MMGSLYLTKAISLTLLQSGGTTAFMAAYVAAAALCGLGLAEALSVLLPANMGHALTVYCAISACSGFLWVRFYDRAG